MSAVAILRPSRFRVREILRDKTPLEGEQLSTIDECVRRSMDVWVGMIDDEVYCVWGVIPPTILSNRAYLWLYTNEEKVAEKQFTFIRQSQIAVKRMLEDFDILFGTTDARNKKTIRWLRWLGAEFERGLGGQLDFKIRRN